MGSGTTVPLEQEPVSLGALPFGPLNMMSLGYDGSKFGMETAFNVNTASDGSDL
jgi:hypothetical protein